MTYTYDESTKTLTITYSNDPVVQRRTEYNDNIVEIINVKGSFTSTAMDCFHDYSPVYEVNLPESITHIGNSVLAGTKVRIFHIPFNTRSLDGAQSFDWCDTIEEFTIDDKQPNFAVVDGVLFSKDMKIIYSFPNAKKCAVYHVPNGVERVVTACFAQTKYLKHIILPTTINFVENVFLYGDPSAKNVTVIKCPCQDPNATIEWRKTSDGIFEAKNAIFKNFGYNETLSSDGKTLIVSPMIACGKLFNRVDFNDTSFAGSKTIETVIFESGIERISSESFKNCKKLKRVSFSNTIKYINSNAFSGCKIGYNSIIYSSDSLKMLLRHFSRYSLGIIKYSCDNGNQSHHVLWLIVVTLSYQ